MVISVEIVGIVSLILLQSGGLIWKLSDLTRQAKTTNKRLERIEAHLYNGGHHE